MEVADRHEHPGHRHRRSAHAGDRPHRCGILGEKEFNGIFHEGKKESLHISLVGDRVILVICFDDRSSLGLVRLRVKKASLELLKVLDEIEKKSERERETIEAAGFESPFAEITDEDIDSLFSD